MSMVAKVQTIWSHCLDRISDLVPQYSYNTWIRPIRAISIEEKDGKILNLEVPNLFHQQWLEEHYVDIVRNTIRDILGPQAIFQFSLAKTEEIQVPLPPPLTGQSGMSQHTAVLPQPKRAVQETTAPGLVKEAVNRVEQIPINQHNTPPRQPKKQPDFGLNKSYNFNTLIKGEGNQLACSAGEAIAKKPGATSFNPLFVYGASGLGKTHLAQAICQHAIHYQTAKSPIYISAIDFTNQFISSIRAHRCQEFTSYFRKTDLLIIDDIQFLSGKERTQEEFFHLFNTIHQSGGQIVLCADRSPGEIPELHNRLISRFQWGLTTDIKAPDFKTRMEIVKTKAEKFHISLAAEIIEKIAANVRRNVREIESVLAKLLAHSSLHKATISLSLVEQVLQQFGEALPTHISIDEIIAIVAETFGTRPEYIVGKSRKREIVVARHTAMYLVKEFTNHSLKSIGLHFAGRDHSTVIHAIKMVDTRLETEPMYAHKFEHSKQSVQLRADGLRNNIATVDPARN